MISEPWQVPIMVMLGLFMLEFLLGLLFPRPVRAPPRWLYGWLLWAWPGALWVLGLALLTASLIFVMGDALANRIIGIMGALATVMVLLGRQYERKPRTQPTRPDNDEHHAEQAGGH